MVDVSAQSWLINFAFGLRHLSSETPLRLRLRFRHHFPYHLALRTTAVTTTHLRKHLQTHILPNNYKIQHTFTTNIHHTTSQGDIPLTTIYKPLHNQLPTPLTLNTIPTIPTTTTFRSLITSRATFEVSSNLQTTFCRTPSHHDYGNSTSEDNILRNTATTTYIQTQPLLPIQQLLRTTFVSS